MRHYFIISVLFVASGLLGYFLVLEPFENNFEDRSVLSDSSEIKNSATSTSSEDSFEDEEITQEDLSDDGAASNTKGEKDQKEQAATLSNAEKKDGKTYTIQKRVASDGWGEVMSELGFSFHYPADRSGVGWGDDEYFQVVLFALPQVIYSDEETIDIVDSVLDSLDIFYGMSITVIEDDASIELKDRVAFYISDEEKYKNKEDKIISEELLPITLAGEQGYILIRTTEADLEWKGLYRIEKDIFLRKGSLVYRFSYADVAEGAIFPEIAHEAKEFINNTHDLAEEVLGTFVFDDSHTTRIIPPKASQPSLTDEEKAFFSSIQKEPHFDKSIVRESLDESCLGEEVPEEELDHDPQNTMRYSRSLYFNVDTEHADIHGYDEKERHTGVVMSMPGHELGFVEEMARGMSWTGFGSNDYLILNENVDGRIEIVGKKYGGFFLDIRTNGNSCTIVSVFVPSTPYSTATIPLTAAGDMGPISYDIDGDGVEDMQISLRHPLVPEKEERILEFIKERM